MLPPILAKLVVFCFSLGHFCEVEVVGMVVSKALMDVMEAG